MNDLCKRLLDEALWADMNGNHRRAKLLTEAIQEIENARHIRGAADEGAKQSGDADQRPSPRDWD
jgi:hypothetical protein